jgi:pimeloyl-ACP methyl ester carboxylesterase
MVGASLGASIAARFAIAHPDRLSQLVLVNAGSLARFRPAPGVLLALVRFLARPSERTQRGFLRQVVVVDPARAAAVLGADSQAYGLELARTPSVPGRQPPAAAGAGDPGDPHRAARRHRRAHDPDLGPPGPGDAAADRREGQRPLRLAARGDRGRRSPLA